MQAFCTIFFMGKVIARNSDLKGSVIVGGRHAPEV